jgi:hypothetical protein
LLVVDPLPAVSVGGEAVQPAVGSVDVVLDAPVSARTWDLEQGVELLADERLVAEPAVE